MTGPVPQNWPRERARGVRPAPAEGLWRSSEVDQLAETAQVWYKEKFRPSKGDRLLDFQLSCPGYAV